MIHFLRSCTVCIAYPAFPSNAILNLLANDLCELVSRCREEAEALWGDLPPILRLENAAGRFCDILDETKHLGYRKYVRVDLGRIRRKVVCGFVKSVLGN